MTTRGVTRQIPYCKRFAALFSWRLTGTRDNLQPFFHSMTPDSDLPLPPFFEELAQKVEALDSYVDHLARSMKVYDENNPEDFPNLDLDHLAHLRGLMILVKLVLSDFRDDAESLRETKECFEILGIKPGPKEKP